MGLPKKKWIFLFSSVPLKPVAVKKYEEKKSLTKWKLCCVGSWSREVVKEMYVSPATYDV